MDIGVATEVSDPPGKSKPGKMEEAFQDFERLLFPDIDDSGIDSDSSARQLEEINGHLSDGSSTEDELHLDAYYSLMAKPWREVIKKSKDGDFLKALEDGSINPLEINWPMGHRQPDLHRIYGDLGVNPERASPPLHEVELTASEEDDDASILELVIPMQPPRYKRVPTASPQKAKPTPKPKVNRTYYSFLCCMGK